MSQFIIILVLVVASGYLLERFLISILGYYIFRFLTAPGIIVHELSHAICAILFRAKIKSFQVFKLEGGEVRYTQPIFPFLTNPIISISPILGCSIVIFFAGNLLGFDFHHFNLQFSYSDLFSFFKSFDFTSVKTYLFLYLMLSLTSAMAPSRKDLTNSFYGLLFIFMIFFLINYYLPSSSIVFLKIGYFYLIGFYMIVLALTITATFWFLKFISFKLIFKRG